MGLTTNNQGRERPGDKIRLKPAVTFVIVLAYCTLFLVRMSASWPASLRSLNRACTESVYAVVGSVTWFLPASAGGNLIRTAVYLLLVAGLVPAAGAWVSGIRSVSDIGLRIPNRLAWRYLLVGLLASMPFLWWMSRGERFADSYLPELKRSGVAIFLVYYFINMLTEHFFLQGVLLAVCRRSGKWPDPVGMDRRGAGGDGMAAKAAAWLGWSGLNRNRSEHGGAGRTLGLPAHCLFPIVASSVIFGLAHLGKDARELLLSFPGGMILAFMAYRTNTWLTPFVLHLLTAGTACLLIVL